MNFARPHAASSVSSLGSRDSAGSLGTQRLSVESKLQQLKEKESELEKKIKAEELDHIEWQRNRARSLNEKEERSVAKEKKALKEILEDAASIGDSASAEWKKAQLEKHSAREEPIEVALSKETIQKGKERRQMELDNLVEDLNKVRRKRKEHEAKLECIEDKLFEIEFEGNLHDAEQLASQENGTSASQIRGAPANKMSPEPGDNVSDASTTVVKSQSEDSKSSVSGGNNRTACGEDSETGSGSEWYEPILRENFPCEDKPTGCSKKHFNVFLSHRGSNKGFTKYYAVLLRDVLARLDITAFVDVKDMYSGANEKRKSQGTIFCALDHCDMFVALVNKNYFESKYCLAEFQAALEKKAKKLEKGEESKIFGPHVVTVDSLDHILNLEEPPEDCKLGHELFKTFRSEIFQDTVPFDMNELNFDPGLTEKLALSIWSRLTQPCGQFYTWFQWSDLLALENLHVNEDKHEVHLYLELRNTKPLEGLKRIRARDNAYDNKQLRGNIDDTVKDIAEFRRTKEERIASMSDMLKKARKKQNKLEKEWSKIEENLEKDVTPAKAFSIYSKWLEVRTDDEWNEYWEIDQMRRSAKFFITDRIIWSIMGVLGEKDPDKKLKDDGYVNKFGEVDVDSSKLVEEAGKRPEWVFDALESLNKDARGSQGVSWQDALSTVLEMDRWNAIIRLGSPWVSKQQLNQWKQDLGTAWEKFEKYCVENIGLVGHGFEPGEKIRNTVDKHFSLFFEGLRALHKSQEHVDVERQHPPKAEYQKAYAIFLEKLQPTVCPGMIDAAMDCLAPRDPVEAKRKDYPSFDEDERERLESIISRWKTKVFEVYGSRLEKGKMIGADEETRSSLDFHKRHPEILVEN